MKSLTRFVIGWLAVWCQVLLVAIAPLGPLAAMQDPLANLPICHSDAEDGPRAPSQPAHSDHDCILCVICQAHGGPIALLSPARMPVRQQTARPVRFNDTQPRAPPSSHTIAAQPRGPPILI